MHTALRLVAIVGFTVLLTAVPQTLAALSDGPISDERRTVRSMQRLLFLDRTLASKFALTTPETAKTWEQERSHVRPNVRPPVVTEHLDTRAPVPRLMWLTRLLTVNVLHHSNYT